MTMLGPNLDKLMTNAAYDLKPTLATGKYIADIDGFMVKKYINYYSLWNQNEFAAIVRLSDDAIPIVDQVWINKDFRRQKLFSKMLWFFKTRLNHPQLLLGRIHSNDMQEVVLGLSRFKKSWYKNGVIEPFNKDTIDNYYSYAGPTKWFLMLENDGDFSDWPQFNSLNGMPDYIRESYDWQIE